MWKQHLLVGVLLAGTSVALAAQTAAAALRAEVLFGCEGVSP